MDEHGFSPDCPGCSAKLKRGAQRAHTDACRQRIWDLVSKSGEGQEQIERERARMDRHFQDIVARDIAKNQELAEEEAKL